MRLRSRSLAEGIRKVKRPRGNRRPINSSPTYTPSQTLHMHVYLSYMILNTALINQYISHGVRFENLGPFDDAMGEMGAP